MTAGPWFPGRLVLKLFEVSAYCFLKGPSKFTTVKFGAYVIALARELASSYASYFSHDKLNSEGRKVFEEISRALVREHPELKRVVARARRDPSLNNVMRVLERILGEEAWELLKGSIEPPSSGCSRAS